MELTFRAAKGKADAEIIDRIQCLCSVEITARIGPGHWTRQSDIPSVLRGMRRRKTFLVYSAGETEAIASFAVGDKMPRFIPASIWRMPHAPALGVFGIAVLPPLQHQGIGTEIMRWIEQIARERGFRFVRLDAYEANSLSVGFYRKLGYDERGRLSGSVPLLCFEYEVDGEGQLFSEQEPL